jgi:hypothetical protein
MIEVVGIEGSEEHAVALALASAMGSLWKGLADSPADQELVRIAANTKLSGYEVSDIDVVVAARFSQPRYFVPRKPILDQSGGQASGKKVRVLGFVAAVEVKGQGPSAIRVQGDEVNVAYREGWKSATAQNIKQVHALSRYFKDQWVDVHVFRCLVLQGVQQFELRGGVQVPASGAVPLGFSGTDFLAALAGVNGVQRWDSGDLFLSSGRPEKLDKVLGSRIFKQVVPSALDRTRMDRIASRPAEASRLAPLLGKQRIHLRGRGGTGKTMLMLQAAHEAYSLLGRRTLVLTYNLALAADIQRLLALMGIPGTSDGGGIEVRTAMAYIFGWFRRLGVTSDEEPTGYEDYEDKCREALELFAAGGLATKDIEDRVAADPWGLDFDAVIIDEAQDWPQAEADLLARIHGPSRLALADGVDQLVRGRRPTNWRSSLPRSEASEDLPLDLGLRMKRNLGLFANSIAELAGITWSIKPSTQAAGGRVILLDGAYAQNRDLQEDLARDAAATGNSRIDFLHCVSPSTVSNDATGQARSELGLALAAKGEVVWDGVSRNVRKDFPRTPDTYRILQFDSCRGLEGWTTVLEGFDSFWAHKHEVALSSKGPVARGEFLAPAEAASLEAWRWAMIALTRPIDTLVVSFHDPGSSVRRVFEDAARRHEDFVEWR